MKGKHLASSRSHVGKEGGEEGVGNQLRGEIMLGDLLWVRLHGSSWWPAQVVDANAVSESIKPSNRSVGEVLVRLYGSYNYLYVDPMKCRSEFENIRKQYNGSYTEIFQKALERDLPHSKSGRSKGQGSNSKVGVEVSNDDKLKQNRIDENQETEVSKSGSGVLRKHLAVSVRRTKAQKTNLVAKSPEDNVSENEGTRQHRVKNINLVNAVTSYQARVSPRRQSASNSQQTTVRKVQKKPKPNSQSNEEEAIDNSEQDGVPKKLKPNIPSIEDKAGGKISKQDEELKKLKLNSPRVKGERKDKNSKQVGVQKKRKPISPSAEGEEKSMTSKQDGVRKKLSLNSPKTEEAKGKTSNQDGLRKKLKLNAPSVEGEAKSKTPKQDRVRKKLKPNSPSTEEAKSSKTPKENRLQKKLKPNSPNSETTSLGKSQELSARRMKVMQSLGLIAPSGSPFNKDSRI